MLSLAKFIKKEIELRENLVGTGFIDPPQTTKKKVTRNRRTVTETESPFRVTVIGEIVKATGFNADNTCVFYDTFIPEGWGFEDCNEYEIYGSYRDETVEYNKR